jgi:hypothetical protein
MSDNPDLIAAAREVCECGHLKSEHSRVAAGLACMAFDPQFRRDLMRRCPCDVFKLAPNPQQVRVELAANEYLALYNNGKMSATQMTAAFAAQHATEQVKVKVAEIAAELREILERPRSGSDLPINDAFKLVARLETDAKDD